MKPNHEQLLGYLLGALEESERGEVERELEQDSELQQHLEALRDSLEPLAESYREYEPPPDLAENTCGMVEQHADAERIALASSGLASAMSGPSRNRFSMADAVVAAGIFLAASLLFFPAILHSHHLARLTSCQNNLRQIGLAMADYSDKVGHGYYPRVPIEGKRAFSGIFAPVLQEYGYLPEAGLLLCPSSRLAQQHEGFRIPTLAEVDRAEGRAIVVIRQTAGGSYGYSLGFVVDGEHRAPRNQGRSHFALMGDAPDPSRPEMGSGNHGRRGQNLLFEDGHVRFVTECQSPECPDHPFQNHFGHVEAGVDENDSVIAPSFAPPFRYISGPGTPARRLRN